MLGKGLRRFVRGIRDLQCKLDVVKLGISIVWFGGWEDRKSEFAIVEEAGGRGRFVRRGMWWGLPLGCL